MSPAALGTVHLARGLAQPRAVEDAAQLLCLALCSGGSVPVRGCESAQQNK